MPGDLIISWTVRAAMLLYVAALAVQIYRPRSVRSRLVFESLWSAGCAIFVTHVIAAFAWYHHFSHAHAFADTAAKTEQMIGIEFGYGLYFSYLFTVLWVVDAIAGVVSLYYRGEHQAGWLRIAAHAYLFFIAINGAIVFHSGVTRWAGVAAIAGLAAWAIVCRGRMGTVPVSKQADPAT